MPQSGALLVRTFVSRAQLPVPDATVLVYRTEQDGRHTLLAIRATDESGIAGPISLESGDSMGQSPNGPSPFQNYQLIVEHPGYQLAVYENLQVFSGVETVQDIPLLPLSVPEGEDSNTTTVTPQEL